MNRITEKALIAVEKIRKAVDALPEGKKFFVGHSGGKDSSTVENLTRLAVGQFVAIHNPKQNTHPDTLTHLYGLTMKFPVVFVPFPQMGDYLKANNYLLEIDGTRRDEYTRSDKSSTYICNGQDLNREFMPEYVENGIFGLNLLYPIYDWSDEDVFEFHRTFRIPLSKEYDGQW